MVKLFYIVLHKRYEKYIWVIEYISFQLRDIDIGRKVRLVPYHYFSFLYKKI